MIQLYTPNPQSTFDPVGSMMRGQQTRNDNIKMGLMKEQAGFQREEAERKNRLFEQEQAEYAEKKAEGERFVDLDDGRLGARGKGMPDNVITKREKLASDLGYIEINPVTGKPGIRTKNMAKIQAHYMQNKEFQFEEIQENLISLDGQDAELGRQLSEEKNPEKLAPIQAKINQNMQLKQELISDGEHLLRLLNPEKAMAQSSAERIAGMKSKTTDKIHESKDELIRLQNIRSAIAQSNPDDPRIAQIDQRIAKITAPPASLVNINLQKPASAGERTALAEGQASIDALDNLETLFDKTFVGPLEGRKGSVLELLGGNEQAQSEFIAATASFKNQIIKEITGAQMSEVEAKRILKQVPDINNPDTVWKARLNQSRENIKRLQKRRQEILEKSGLKSGSFDSGSISDISDDELRKQLGIE